MKNKKWTLIQRKEKERKTKNDKNRVACTESLKGLCLDLYGFYLVILPLGIR